MTAGGRTNEAFVSGLVLAGGAGSRMGRVKQLMPLAGRPVLKHVLDAAGAAKRLSEVVLVLGAGAERVRAGLATTEGARFKVVVNEKWAEGIASSLQAGVRGVDSRASAVCVLLGDQPAVSAAVIDRMIEAFVSGDKPFVRPVYRNSNGKRVPGHPVIVAREMWPEIQRLRGDEGLRSTFVAHPERLESILVDGAPPADIDDEGDYERARREYEH